MGQLRVDSDEIERHVAAERSRGHESVGLLVTMPGSDPERLARHVRTVLREIPGGVATYPTSFGCYTHVREASACGAAVEGLAASVSGEALPSEVEVRVAPPRPAARSWWSVLRDGQRPRPAAQMGFSLTPVLWDRDRDPSGKPYGGWGVANDVTQRLVEHAGPWVSASGEEGEAFDGPRRIALAADDAVGVMGRMARTSFPGFDTWFPEPGRGDGGRDVSFGYWGQVAYVRAGSHLDNAAVALEMAEVLRHHAADLDVGAVRPGQVGRTGNFGYVESLWLENRHLWTSHVQQPNAIQVLTSAHVERAHDLSSWAVERVAEDRWLVATPDLGPWFDHAGDDDAQNVPLDVMESAVSDFGDMLLTPEVAAAHPLPSRTGD
ncbi:hypothetical protein [Nocardioides sp. zg-1230]|uniref:hypothetical protein n=1 Tax=Nocardioides sp. zg-1230 TaxID=2736601 RepID=UPI0015533C4C|nr:hypothetical protein [Nocardioides sp. zg-1230]NPC43762.1 hypothetical protein [Nocardioides sp. zg-1230]